MEKKKNLDFLFAIDFLEGFFWVLGTMVSGVRPSLFLFPAANLGHWWKGMGKY